MVFKLKIVAEAEAVENNSEIAREYGVSPLLAKGSGQTVQRRIEDVGKADKDGSLHSEVS